MLEMAPGQDTMSLLVAPEGRLISLFEIEQAMREEGLDPPRPVESFDGGDENDEADDRSADPYGQSNSQPESWSDSLDSKPFDEWTDFDRRPQHPTVERAEQLLREIMKLRVRDSGRDSFASVATRGLMDIVGGLVQATHDGHDARSDRALAIVQLKRALKGHAFCRGAIFGLRGTDQIDKMNSDRFHEELEAILESIHDLMAAAWDEGET
jgi:hypothetical protein